MLVGAELSIGNFELLPGLEPEPVEVFWGAEPPLLPGFWELSFILGMTDLQL